MMSLCGQKLLSLTGVSMPVDKVKVMNSLGILDSVRNYVDHEFYYSDMSGIEMPEPTREKLDMLFPNC